jgi:hypothetical protein
MSLPSTLDVVRPRLRRRVPVPGVRTSFRRRRTWVAALRRDWQLYSLAILPLLFFLIFRYLPMLGNVIAFRRFRPGGSIFGERWVGLRYVPAVPGRPLVLGRLHQHAHHRRAHAWPSASRCRSCWP